MTDLTGYSIKITDRPGARSAETCRVRIPFQHQLCVDQEFAPHRSRRWGRYLPAYDLQALEGAHLRTPAEASARPNPEFLEWRFLKFQDSHQ